LVLVDAKFDKLPLMINSTILILIASQAAANAAPTAALPPAPQVLPTPAPPPPPASVTPYVPVPPKPKGNPGTWVRNSDYPKELKNGESGTTQFRLHVSDKGKPVACDILRSSGHPVLDAKTCEIMMRRAEFVPAQSGYGKVTYGTYTSRMRWGTPRTQ
jgi:protein TonB